MKSGGDGHGGEPLRRDHHRRRPQRPGLRHLPRQGRPEGAGAGAPPRLRRRRGHRGVRAGLPRLDLLLRDEHPAPADHRRPRAAPVRARGAAGQRPVLPALGQRPPHLLRRREEDPGQLRPLLDEGCRGLPGVRRLSAGIAEDRPPAAVPDAGRPDQGATGALQGDGAARLGVSQDRHASSTASSICSPSPPTTISRNGSRATSSRRCSPTTPRSAPSPAPRRRARPTCSCTT